MSAALSGNASNGIVYRSGNDIDVSAMIELYRDSTLGERRPIDDVDTMTAMLQNANLVVTAWDADTLVGIARSVSDFAYVTYLSDLAVRRACQRQGIGRELVRQTQARAPNATIVLLAAPAAVDYYPRIGFTRHPQAWVLRPSDSVR